MTVKLSPTVAEMIVRQQEELHAPLRRVLEQMNFVDVWTNSLAAQNNAYLEVMAEVWAEPLRRMGAVVTAAMQANDGLLRSFDWIDRWDYSEMLKLAVAAPPTMHVLNQVCAGVELDLTDADSVADRADVAVLLGIVVMTMLVVWAVQMTYSPVKEVQQTAENVLSPLCMLWVALVTVYRHGSPPSSASETDA